MKTAVISVVKNAEFRIAEWIAYQIAVGFDTVILLDNASTDGTAGVIRTFAPLYDVRLIDWPMTGPAYQTRGFEYALWSGRKEFDWCACIDVDEFIVPAPTEYVKDMVRRGGDASAIAVPWAFFGSNGLAETPKGLVIDNYIRRSVPEFGPNRHIKSFVRPNSLVKGISAHFFEVDGIYVDTAGRIIEEPTSLLSEVVTYKYGKINHYFVQSKKCWADKLSRGYHDMIRPAEEFDAYDRNEEEDQSARRFSRSVFRIIASTGA